MNVVRIKDYLKIKKKTIRKESVLGIFFFSLFILFFLIGIFRGGSQ